MPPAGLIKAAMPSMPLIARFVRRFLADTVARLMAGLPSGSYLVIGRKP
jgi:hypothetical protein